MLNSDVSIIIPVRNEIKFIKNTLTSIFNQDYHQEKIEIIISDGKSSDNTLKEIKKIKPEKIKLKIVENIKLTMPSGFNLALKSSNSDFVVMMGGHSIIPENYISKSIENIKKYNAHCSGGVLETVGRGFWGKIIASVMSSTFGVGNVSFRVNNAKSKFVNSVPFGCYQREVFERIGFLDEDLIRNQDDEFNFRMTQAGMKIWQDSSLKIKYFSRSNLLSFSRQYFEYGLFKIRVLQKRKKILALRHLIPGLFVLSLFLPHVSQYSFLAYLTVGIFFSIKIGRLNFIKWLPLLITFFITHVSYGIGFILGFFRFGANWLK